MKMQVICALLLAATAPVMGDSPGDLPHGETAASTSKLVENLGWSAVPAPDRWNFPLADIKALDCELIPQSGQSGPHGEPLSGLKLTYSSTQAQWLLLSRHWFALEQRKMLKPHTITGEIRCRESWPGSYLQITTLRVQSMGTYEHSDDLGGPLLDLVPDDKWHAFQFTTTQDQLRDGLRALDLQLLLVGPCTLEVRNLKFWEAEKAGTALDSDGTIVDSYTATSGQQVQAGGLTTVWTIDHPKVTSSHFAVLGEARYRNLNHGSFYVFANFLPENPETPAFEVGNANLGKEGMFASFEGTSDTWRPFCVPVDAHAATTRLKSLVVNFSGTGAGSALMYRRLRLVEYPEGFPPSWRDAPLSVTSKYLLELEVTNSDPRPEHSNAASPSQTAGKSPDAHTPGLPVQVPGPAFVLDWKSFVLGVILTLGVGAFAASISILRRGLKRRAHEKELRRIESIDG